MLYVHSSARKFFFIVGKSEFYNLGGGGGGGYIDWSQKAGELYNCINAPAEI